MTILGTPHSIVLIVPVFLGMASGEALWNQLDDTRFLGGLLIIFLALDINMIRLGDFG